MNDETTEIVEEQLASWLADCDDAMAVGQPTSSFRHPIPSADQQTRIERDLACVRLLREYWSESGTWSEANSRLDSMDGTRDAGSHTLPATIGRFQIRRQIGEGGYGVVFLAFDPQLGREIALKIPRADVLVSSDLRARFQHEARTAASLDHSNIVQVFEAGEIGLVCYIASAYCPGPNLAEWIRQPEPASFKTAAEIVAALADAVQHAHSRGVLHRDLKPANVLLMGLGVRGWGFEKTIEATKPSLTPDTQPLFPKITDFGLAKLLEDVDSTRTQTGAIMGTPNYMAPEQAAGRAKEVSTASDVHALGAILYELLTGQPPFRADTTLEVLRKIESEEPIPPHRLRPRTPRDLETICLKCLQKEPHRRYVAAGSLRDDLQRFLANEPVIARPIGRAERASRWCRRHPSEAILLSLIALLLVGVLVGSSWSALAFRKQRNEAIDLKIKAERSANSEAVARRDATDKLWQSYLSQAQARRWSGQPGRRFQSLDALTDAARIRPTLELRNEAVACLPLVDLRVARQWHRADLTFDPDLERHARSDSEGNIIVCRVVDDVEIARLPGFGVAAGCDFSPDGQFLIAYYVPVCIQVWDLNRKKVVLKVEAPAGSGSHFNHDFSRDSRRVAINVADGFVRIFDLESGDELKQFRLGSGPMSVKFHPQERKLAVSPFWTSTLRIVDTDTGDAIGTVTTPAEIKAFAWRPDGTLLAIACSDTTIRLYNTKSKTFYKVLEGHQNVVMSVAFNHAGTLLTSHSWDSSTRLWDPVSGKQLVSSPGYSLRFSRDDQRLAYSFYGLREECGLWEIAAGRECRVYHTFTPARGPDTVDIHPQGRLLATGHDDGVRVWDLTTGSELIVLPTGRSSARFDRIDGSLITSNNLVVQRWSIILDSRDGTLEIGSVTEICKPAGKVNLLSRDGRWLGTVAESGDFVVTNLERPAEQIRLQGHPGIWQFDVSSDGSWIATGTQHGSGIKVWNGQNGEFAHEFAAAHYGIVEFSPDGRFLATGSAGHETQLWEVGSWQLKRQWNYFRAGSYFSRDSSMLAIKHTREALITLIDVESGAELTTLPAPEPHPISDVCFSPDNGQIAVGCYTAHLAQLWDLQGIRRQLAEMRLDWNPPSNSTQNSTAENRRLQLVSPQGHREVARLTGHSQSVARATFSPDGSLIASASMDSTVRIWSWPEGQLLRTLHGHSSDVLFAAFSPDSKTLASTGRDRKLILWDVAKGEKKTVHEDHSDEVNWCAFSSDGQLLVTGANDKTVKLRDGSGIVQSVLATRRGVASLDISPDGKTLVSAGGDWNATDKFGEVTLWDLRTGKPRLTIPGEFGGIWSIVFSPNGKTLAGACLDGTVRLWDALTGDEQRVLRGHTDRVIGVAFSPDSMTIASGSLDSTARLWNSMTGQATSILLGHTVGVERPSFSPDGRTLATPSRDCTVRLWELHPPTQTH